MKNRQEDQRNLLIAVVLSMAVMLAWQVFYAGPQMKAQQEQARLKKAAEAEAKSNEKTSAVEGNTTAASSSGSVKQGGIIPAATRDEAIARTSRVQIDTPTLNGSISLTGGLVDDLVLKKYRETVDPQSPNIVLFSPIGSPKAYFGEYGWQAAGQSTIALPGSDTVWTAPEGAKLTPSTPVTLTWENGSGLTFKRTFSIDENYMIAITDEVKNATPGDIALTPYSRLYRFGKPKTEGFFVIHEGLIGVPGDAGLEEITYDGVLEDGGAKFFEGKKGGWVGITDKYWAAVLVPDQKTAYSASFRGRSGAVGKQPLFWVDYQLTPKIVSAGQSLKISSQLFAGAKQVNVIEDYDEQLAIDKFELLVDWGWFYFITKPLFHILDFFYGLLGNFGLAIIAVTILVKLVFFPLANKSYESMAKMKKLAPKMEELKERYKDDKQKMQQELMALYQKEKINPLAGCLPILIQIPVFFALYKVLFVSIDMRHAPFYGWIQDLSVKDPTSIFNLFGLLPFGVPDFLVIGIWPIIMGVTMWVQMQLNPPQPDPVQQQMFAWMPLIFTFLLASFPAGLVIYWAWNNILSVAQQWYISRKQGVEIHLMDNLRRTFAPIAKLLGLKKASEAEGES